MNYRKEITWRRLGLALTFVSLVSVPAVIRLWRADSGLRNQQRMESQAAELRNRSAVINATLPGGISNPQSEGLPSTTARAREVYGQLPLSFEVNQGQTDARVKFLSRGAGYNLFLTSNEAILQLRNSNLGLGNPESALLRMKLVGANKTPRIEGIDQLPGHSNYFIGRDPKKWRTNVPQYARARYREIYPGVDLVYYGNQRQLEYDFIVAPGADLSVITLAFDGAKRITTDKAGDLLLETPGSEVRLQKPVIYQLIDGVRREIAGNYVLKSGRDVGFDVGAYDHTRSLIVDPVLVYSTYLGGNGVFAAEDDEGRDIVVDSVGNAYVTGRTESSTNFPLVNAIRSTRGGDDDAFVTKFNAAGTALIYSTYLGGTGTREEWAQGIAVDADGNAYVTGETGSTDFPTTAGAFQTTLPGFIDAFATKLGPTGSLVYSTFLGGTGTDSGRDIAVDNSGNAYVVGFTSSNNFPTLNPLQQAKNGFFLTKLNQAGSALVYSTYIGTPNGEYPRGVAVDTVGNAYVVGSTSSSSFPVVNAFQPTYGGGARDVFVTKVNPGGTALVYSTFLGGSGEDDAGNPSVSGTGAGQCIAIDNFGNAYVTGKTYSTNFPVKNAFQPGFGGNPDAFVTKFNTNASGSASLVYSTYLGGSGTETGYGIAVNVLGQAYVTGDTDSNNFPLANAIQSAPNDMFVTKFNAAGTALVYSTYFGGIGLDRGQAIAVDGAGNAFATGITKGNFPTRNPVQPAIGGNGDAFVTVIADPTIIGRVVDEDGNPISTATVNLTGVPTATTTTDANGYFTFGLLTVANNYTVSVSVSTYIFNSQVVNNLQKNVRLDFSPVVVSISGQVTATGTTNPVSGVTMSLTGGKILNTQTNASGNYSLGNLPAGRNYTVTPSKNILTFVPTSTTFNSISINQAANFQASPEWEPTVLTASQAELTAWTYQGTTYAYLKLSFPKDAYRVVNWGQVVRVGNDFSADASVEKWTGISVLAVTTTAQIYDLGILSPGSYNFTFKNSGTVVKTLSFTITGPPFPPNPIDDARFFVRQQYRDFLNREADQAGEDFWTDNITRCSDPARRPAGQTEAQCTLRQRETTSGAFFLSPEFQYTGYFVYRVYQGGLGRRPKLSEFLPDATFVGAGIVVNGQLSGAKIEQNKAAFAAQFVNCVDATKYRCGEFKAIYDGLSNQQYVDKLFLTTGVNASASDRTALVNGLNGLTETRASVLQKVVDGVVVIAEGNQQFTTTYGQAFYNSESNRAFVLLEYFGYMKRDPDDAGYAFWLDKLNQFGGNFVNAEMVLAFISSPEYRARFGQP